MLHVYIDDITTSGALSDTLIYINRLKKTLKSEFYCKPMGTVLTLRLDSSRNSQMGGWRLREATKGSQDGAYSKMGHQAPVHSDLMVLVLARRKAVPRERWPKRLKGELENNSRKPSDLVGKLV
jgi:hypothetical protein